MKQKVKNIGLDILIVLAPVIVFTIWILTKWSINYQVHDDRYMMEFLSGKFLGYSDAHVVYIKYLLALAIQFLYKLFEGHDWYATVMLTIQILSMCIMSWYCVRKQKSIFSKLICQVLFYSVFILCWINEVTCFTYSTVAAFVSVTIIVVYAVGENRVRDYTLILILCFIAFNLRSDLFFMVTPICGILWLIKVCSENKKQQVILLGLILIIIGASYGAEKMAYSSTEWSNYVKYNQARTKVFDYAYDDLIEYDKYSKMYDKLGISKEQCKIIETYDLSLYDNKLYDKIDDISKEYVNNRTFSQKIKNMITAVIKDGLLESKMMTIVSIVVWLIAFCCALVRKEYKVLLLEIVFLLLHISLWVYLGYRGRILPRVSHSMLLMQIVSACICVYCIYKKEENVITDKRKRMFTGALLVCAIFVSLYDIRLSSKLMTKNQREADYQDQYIIEKYCNDHSENFYFLDVFSVVECKYVFDFNNSNTYENFLSLGDWFGNSPLYNNKLKVEKIDSVRKAVLEDENVFVIGIKGKDMNFISDITDKNVVIKEVDFLDGGMDDYVVYSVSQQ